MYKIVDDVITDTIDNKIRGTPLKRCNQPLGNDL